MLEGKCHCCQSLNFSETALITLMEEPCRMAVVRKPWSYCWCKRRARARAALPNLSLMANTGPQRPSCFAPGNCGGETFNPANTKGCDAHRAIEGKGEQICWSVETRWAGGTWLKVEEGHLASRYPKGILWASVCGKALRYKCSRLWKLFP